MARRILFLIRGKLGDSLVFFAALQRFLDRNPDVEATLAIRKDYAFLVEGGARMRLMPFGSRAGLLARLLLARLLRRRFDVFAVLWGFGPVVENASRLSGAARRIYIDGRRPAFFPEWPDPAEDMQIVDPAWRVLRRLDPELPRPDALSLPALASRRRPGTAICVVPFADEPRKCLDAASCRRLLRHLAARHPGAELRVLVNPADRGAAAVAGADMPPGARILRFTKLEDVVSAYADAMEWYGVDTGLYHMAAGMGLPATVVFGPTRPLKIVMPGQPAATWLRLAVLGDADCMEKSCGNPHCMHRAVGLLAADIPDAADPPGDLPAGCPLRNHEPRALDYLTRHENPRSQA